MANAVHIEMVGDMKRFEDARAARRYPSLWIEVDVFPTESPTTIPTLNLSRGLRRLFNAPE